MGRSAEPLSAADETSDEVSLVEALIATERGRRRELLRIADEIVQRTSGRPHTDSVTLIREGRAR